MEPVRMGMRSSGERYAYSVHYWNVWAKFAMLV